MKKIILSTIVLIAFALSIIIFQVSCKKEANAQSSSYTLPIATTKTLGGVMVDGSSILVDAKGVISAVPSVINPNTEDNVIVYGTEVGTNLDEEIWKVNMDGTGNQKVNIVLPANVGFKFFDRGIKHTRTNKIIFPAKNYTTGLVEIYSCNMDGSGLTKIVSANNIVQF